jgi:predicted oxidoreductase
VDKVRTMITQKEFKIVLMTCGLYAAGVVAGLGCAWKDLGTALTGTLLGVMVVFLRDDILHHEEAE